MAHDDVTVGNQASVFEDVSVELGAVLTAWFGRSWQTRWTSRFAKLDQAAQIKLIGEIGSVLVSRTVGPADALDSTPPAPGPSPGEVWSHVRPVPGQEWRWLTASLFADRVAVSTPVSWVNTVDETKPLSIKRVAFNFCRFATDLVGPLEAGRITLIKEPRLLSITLMRLFHYDRDLQAKIAAIDPRLMIHSGGLARTDIDQGAVPTSEAFEVFQAAQSFGRDQMCLVPSTVKVAAIAEILASRYQRVWMYPATADLVDGFDISPGVRSTSAKTDRRPALFDELMIGAIPSLQQAQPDRVEELVNLDSFIEFRAGMREICREVANAPTALELSVRLDEAKRMLRARAVAASIAARKAKVARLKSIVWQSAGGGTTGALGFVSSSPIEGALSTVAGMAVGALIAAKTVDPDTALDSNQLVLWKLARVSAASKKGRHRASRHR